MVLSGCLRKELISGYFIDRYDGNTLLNCIESYDPGTDAWDLLESNMVSQRCDAGVCVVRKR